MKTSIYEYNGCAISFNKEKESTMVNAVEMAKPFGKQPAWWLRTQAAQDFIKELSDMRKCISYDNVNVRSDAGNLSVKFPSLIKIVKGAQSVKLHRALGSMKMSQSSSPVGCLRHLLYGVMTGSRSWQSTALPLRNRPSTRS